MKRFTHITFTTFATKWCAMGEIGMSRGFDYNIG